MGVLIESIADQYRNQTFPFPDDGVKKSLKNSPAFFKRLADSILGQYVNGYSCFPFQVTKTRSIQELRSYAMGEQSVSKYKPYICQTMNQNGGKAYMNISWSPVRMIPLFRNVIKGIAMKTLYDIQINAVDPSSLAEKKAEEAYLKLQTDPQWQQFSKQMQQMGVRVPKQTFKTEEQLDVWMKSGGLKLAVEIALKTALEATLYLSKFEDSVKVEVIDDLIDLGFAGVRDYVEPGTKYVKARYVDPEYYCGRFSQYLDNHNSDYGAEIRLMTIAELRPYFDEAQLMFIAKKYITNYGNQAARFAGYGIFNTFYVDRYRDVYGSSPIDDFKIPVLDAVYISENIDTYSKKTRKNGGNLIYKLEDEEYQMSEKDKEQGGSVEEKRNQVVYKFKNIIGSDMVFDYGLDEDIALDGADGHKTALNPYHIYKTGTSSIVDLLVAIEDDACLTTYKWRNAKARMLPPPAVAIDETILETQTVGGVKMTAKQAIAMGVETGYLKVRTMTDHGRAVAAPNSSPITPINQSIMDYYNIYAADMAQLFQMAHKITGINDLTAAGNPQDRQGLGVMDTAIQMSNNVIAPLFKGYEVLFEQTMRNCALRWQAVLRNGDVNGYYKGIGSSNLAVFKLTKDISLIEFGLTINALPSEQEKNLLLTQLLEATKNKEITRENYVLIYRTIQSGNLDLAQLQMAWALEQTFQMQQEMKAQDVQANAQVQQQSLQQNILGQQAVEEQKYQYREKEMMLQAQIDKEKAAQEHEYTMRELALKGQFAVEQKNIGAQTDLTKELIKPKPQKAR